MLFCCEHAAHAAAHQLAIELIVRSEYGLEVSAKSVIANGLVQKCVYVIWSGPAGALARLILCRGTPLPSGVRRTTYQLDTIIGENGDPAAEFVQFTLSRCARGCKIKAL
jgi:hypothetical protein